MVVPQLASVKGLDRLCTHESLLEFVCWTATARRASCVHALRRKRQNMHIRFEAGFEASCRARKLWRFSLWKILVKKVSDIVIDQVYDIEIYNT